MIFTAPHPDRLVDDASAPDQTLFETFQHDRAQQLAEWPHCKSLFYQRRKKVLASVPYAA